VSGAVSKAVLVTGCSTGIGRATAERLALPGLDGVRVGSPTGVDQGSRRRRLPAPDARRRRRGVAARRDRRGRSGGGDGGALVNNAGFSLGGPVEEVDLDEWRRQFETNVFGMIRLIQRALPGIRRQRWGRIVNVGSIGGRLTFPGAAAYHASKHAVEAMSDALRYEVKPFGVCVSVIEPGLIRTKFADTAVSTVADLGGGGPYAEFNAGVATLTAGAYEGPMKVLSAPPESVARVIERALRRRRPARATG
jgi:NAD(P)-dependent dehydrogenase (short-subunit alcohol dehydrogenase family)